MPILPIEIDSEWTLAAVADSAETVTVPEGAAFYWTITQEPDAVPRPDYQFFEYHDGSTEFSAGLTAGGRLWLATRRKSERTTISRGWDVSGSANAAVAALAQDLENTRQALEQDFSAGQQVQDARIDVIEDNSWASNYLDSETSYRTLNLTQDEVDQLSRGGSKVNGFRVNMPFGGLDATGGRHAIYGRTIQTAATAAGNTDRNYVGVQGHAIASVNDGGTDHTVMAASKGAHFGASAIAVAESGATHLFNVTGFESNSRVKSGASVAYISGLQIVTKDEVQGGVYDTALGISRGGTGTVGKRVGILFGPMNGSHPVASDGTLISSIGTATVARGIDWTGYTFTGPVLEAPGVRLSQATFALSGLNAGLELGSLTTAGASAIDFHTSGVNQDYDARIVASGGAAGNSKGDLTYHAARHIYSGEMRRGSATGPGWFFGTGTPEGAVAAPVGSYFSRTDGGPGSTMYVKESGGTGNTGWVAK